MKIKNIIFAILFASMMSTEPMATTPLKRFRSAFRSTYKTVRTDIRCLFSGQKMNREQKKRVMIELAIGIALVGITTGVMWFWWVRPLQKPLYIKAQEYEEEKEIYTALHETKTEIDEDDLMEKMGQIPAKTNSIMLHYASKRQDGAGVITWLLDRNYLVDTHDEAGNTPLHIAVLANNENIVELLRNRYANPTVKNRNNKTPRDLAGDNHAIRSKLQQAELDWARSHPH